MYTNNSNGKRYIGQTVDFNTRHANHKHCSRNPKNESYLYRPFYRALKKYGIEGFTVSILREDVADKCALNLLEYYYIKKYKTLASEHGYNIADGGNSGNPYAGKTKEEIEEIGRKISESLRSKYSSGGYTHPMIGRKWTEEQRINTLEARRKIYESDGYVSPLKGRRHTEETRKKMREKRKGKTPCIKPVLQYTKDGVFIKRWSSIREAGTALNISQEGIGRCCMGRYSTSGGYCWKYDE